LELRLPFGGRHSGSCQITFGRVQLGDGETVEIRGDLRDTFEIPARAITATVPAPPRPAEACSDPRNTRRSGGTRTVIPDITKRLPDCRRASPPDTGSQGSAEDDPEETFGQIRRKVTKGWKAGARLSRLTAVIG
jgi:hypothetical protein